MDIVLVFLDLFKYAICGVMVAMFVMIWAAVINISHSLGRIADILDEALKENHDERGTEG